MLLDTVTPQVLDCMGGCSPCAPSSPGVLEGDTWSSDTERPSHSQRRAAKQGVCVCACYGVGGVVHQGCSQVYHPPA